MANITRFSPLRELERWDTFRDIEERLRRLWGRPSPTEAELPAVIALDVTEDDQAYTMKADLPGLSKDDIQVSIDGNRVAINAQVKREKEEKGKNMVCSERYFGQYYRSFTLDQDIDEAKSAASYKDGVLQLTLAKKPGKDAKKLTVH